MCKYKLNMKQVNRKVEILHRSGVQPSERLVNFGNMEAQHKGPPKTPRISRQLGTDGFGGIFLEGIDFGG